MPFVLAVIGAILIIVGIRGNYGALATALETDVPPFMTWGAAMFGVVAIGWVPGMQHISRMLLALVLVVLVLTNYKQILASFSGLASAPSPAPAPATPAATYAATGQASQPGPGGVTGQQSGSGSPGLITASSPLSGLGPPSLGTVSGNLAPLLTII